MSETTTASVQTTALNCDTCGQRMIIEGLGSANCTAVCSNHECIHYHVKYSVEWPKANLVKVSKLNKGDKINGLEITADDKQ